MQVDFHVGSDAFMVVDDGFWVATGVWMPLFEIQKVMVINVRKESPIWMYIVATCPLWSSSPQKIHRLSFGDLMTMEYAEKTLKERQDKLKVST